MSDLSVVLLIVLNHFSYWFYSLSLTQSREITYNSSAVPEQRRARRYELSLPMELVRSGSERLHNELETKNLSSGGVLFQSPPVELEVGQPVEYYITLPVPNSAGPVKLRCMGKVVRRDPPRGVVAATLERWEFVRGQP